MVERANLNFEEEVYVVGIRGSLNTLEQAGSASREVVRSLSLVGALMGVFNCCLGGLAAAG